MRLYCRQKIKPGFYIYVTSFNDKYLIKGKLLITKSIQSSNLNPK
jgi:hypothetical protein